MARLSGYEALRRAIRDETIDAIDVWGAVVEMVRFAKENKAIRDALEPAFKHIALATGCDEI